MYIEILDIGLGSAQMFLLSLNPPHPPTNSLRPRFPPATREQSGTYGSDSFGPTSDNNVAQRSAFPHPESHFQPEKRAEAIVSAS
ncbi:hypothetical protein EYZ11_005197 [Aspergillus tanneri]|uniref:Uncharacterized protein n=1 Tax=Aspergillus tanneri TaxID=1220188 RepID=A0A4S3JKY2_9EURO|nr:hypothetical protein EYZ11_005197 [Aspergillus tanneri]